VTADECRPSLEKDHSAGKLLGSEDLWRAYYIVCGYGPKVLELVEEAFDEVALTIERKVAAARRLAVGFWRNHRGDAAAGKAIDERVGVECLVAQQRLRIDSLQQRRRASQIVGLPRCEPHIDGIAEGIDQDMDFGRQSAARAADRLLAVFFRAPALC
jgi:hypothetical protein